MISRSESRSPSISAASSAPVRSSRGLRRARREHLVEVLEHAQGRLRRRRRQRRARLPRGARRCRPRRAASARSAAGTPSSSLITSIGSLPAKSRDEIAAPASGAGVEVLARDRADPRLELGDAARREAARDQRAHARVARRIHREERHRGVGAARGRRPVERDAVAVREGLDVLERGQHVGVPRQRPEAERLVAVDRRLVAQRAIDRDTGPRGPRRRRGRTRPRASSAGSRDYQHLHCKSNVNLIACGDREEARMALRVGFVGLGNIGKPMARSSSRRASRRPCSTSCGARRRARARGAKPASSPRELAARAT